MGRTIKGLPQVLWERRFIDESKKMMKYYTMTGTKDILGNTIPNTNLTRLVENNVDFLNEVTLLQEILSQVGVTVNCLPKYHAKAGEGIKYS